MIKKLVLKNFGRFMDEAFTLSPVTVFYGENESGKTTIFDALFSSLCQPRGNRKYGGITLSGRYGNDYSAEVLPPASLDADEFMNLYAIRAGDMEIETSAEAGWLQKVKSSLIYGGIDPSRIEEIFMKMSGEDRRPRESISKAIHELDTGLERRLDELGILRAKRKEILSREKAMDVQKELLVRERQKLEELTGEAAGLREELEAKEKSRAREFQDKLESLKLHTGLRTVWNPAALAAGLLTGIAAIAVSLLMDDLTARLLVLGGGLLAAVVLLLLSRRVESVAGGAVLPDAGLPDGDYDRKKAELEGLDKEIEKHRRTIHETEGEVRESTGEIRGALGRLPVDIRSLEEDIFSRKRELEARVLDKKAAALACGIFEEISRDAGSQFDALRKDIMEMLGVIVPEERDLEVKSLDVDRFRMKDAGGTFRDIEMLSDGTRDAFVFAAKLAMAKKASDGARLLVLDEPFLHFDCGRAGNSIGMLRQFFFNEGWQIILFTKDDRIKEMVGQGFGEAAEVHALTAQS